MINIKRNEKILAVTLDHGLTIGPVPGLIDINGIVDEVRKGGASAIVAHKGFIKNLDTLPDIGKINVSTAYGGDSFVLVNNKDIKLKIEPNNADRIVDVCSKITKAASEQLGFFQNLHHRSKM